MYVLREIPDGFDGARKGNEAWIDAGLTDWVATTLEPDSPWYRNVMVYAGAGLAYSVNKLSTEVAAGFFDVLRIGDGVYKNGEWTPEGAWGVGKDALRLLMIAGPLVRAGRYGISLVAAVDETAAAGNCTWISGTRALRMTGVRHYSTVGDLAKAGNLATVAETGGAQVHEILPALQKLGASTEVFYPGQITTLNQVTAVARANPNAVVMFSVEWSMPGRGMVGHTLFATRGPFGVMRIIDRSGRAVTALAELESLYPGISAAKINPGYTAGLVRNAVTVDLLNKAPTLLNILALELRSIPVAVTPKNGAAPVVVLPSNAALLVGWWRVQVGPWTFHYAFGRKGTVRWIDPYSSRRSQGTWKELRDTISITWAPPSKTLETWNTPISGNSQTGRAIIGQEIHDLRAWKFDVRSFVGNWKVQVKNWTRIYTFTEDGAMSWRDSLNNGSGTGFYYIALKKVLLFWSPPSTITEEWDLPLDRGTMQGITKMEGKTYPVSATKE
ncbi:MAG: hypothetical protein ABI972_01305 [Acidobacteriota bacterium]